jgi:RimJ/RimL family protein N-acetyltransferase
MNDNNEHMKNADVKLVDIYDWDPHSDAQAALYSMLAMRPEHANISHKVMPTWTEHCEYTIKRPYREWCLITRDLDGIPEILGQITYTKEREVGIQILKKFQKQGIATKALALLQEKVGETIMLANIAPYNRASLSFFKKNGFELVQHTYICRRSAS